MLKKIKLGISIALSIAIATSSVYGYSTKNVTVNIDGMLQPLKSNVINKDGYTLVAFRDLFEMLEIDVDWNFVTRNITATDNDKKMTINIDTNSVKLNDKYIDFPVDVEIIDDTTYVPLRAVCEAFDMKVDWNQDKQNISIDKGNEYIFLDDIYIQPNTIVLTQEDAVKRAYDINSSIRNLDDAIYYNKEMINELTSQIAGYDHYLPEIESVLKNIKTLEAQVEDKDINEQIIQDSIELSIISSVANIKTLKLNIATLEQTIEINKKNIEDLELKYSFGMIAETELNEAKNNQKNSELSLESLKNTLNTQQNALNNMLDQSYDIDIDIDLYDDFSAIQQIDIESFVTRNIEGDISIQLLKNDLERAEEIKNNYSHTASEEDMIKVYNDINTASRKLQDSKIQLENTIRKNYENLLSLKDTDTSLKLDLQTAINSYNNVVANYISGNATLNQVEQAKLSVLNIEKQIEQNKINFAVSLYTFNKPYLSSNVGA